MSDERPSDKGEGKTVMLLRSREQRGRAVLSEGLMGSAARRLFESVRLERAPFADGRRWWFQYGRGEGRGKVAVYDR
jgi:hypothetical protein